MKQSNQSRVDDPRGTGKAVISRRAVMGCSGLAVVGLLSRSALGQERRGPPPEMRERMEQSRIFSERMRTASGPEEMRKLMEEQRALHRTRAVEDLKGRLGLSDEEWAVIKPRIEAVYNLVHPEPPPMPGDAQPTGAVQQRTRELHELLNNEDTAPDEIRAKLSALRAAKEQERQELVKARQDLRQLMTLRQEAMLVLRGLLD